MRLPWVAIAALGLLAGCSQVPRSGMSYDPAASTALNIVRLAGLDGMTDDPALPVGASGTSLADVGFGASSIARPPPSVGGNGGAALGVASLLGNLPVERPLHNRHVYGWIPAPLADTAEDAATLAQQAVQQAFLAAFDPATALERREGIFSPTLAPTTRHAVWVEPGCPSVVDTHRDDFDRGCSGALRVYVRQRDNLMTVKAAPPFIPGLPLVRGPIELQVVAEGIFSAWWRDHWNVALVSRNLPFWMFVYVPSSAKDGSAARVYAQGNALFFRRP